MRQSTAYSLHQPQGNKEHGTERTGSLYKKSDGCVQSCGGSGWHPVGCRVLLRGQVPGSCSCPYSCRESLPKQMDGGAGPVLRPQIKGRKGFTCPEARPAFSDS